MHLLNNVRKLGPRVGNANSSPLNKHVSTSTHISLTCPVIHSEIVWMSSC